jgi:hypothetical protein
MLPYNDAKDNKVKNEFSEDNEGKALVPPNNRNCANQKNKGVDHRNRQEKRLARGSGEEIALVSGLDIVVFPYFVIRWE